MATDPIGADCKKTYYPAARTSGTRPLKSVKWIVLHVTESRTAKSTAAYFKSDTAQGSTHLVLDDNECYRCLPNSAVCWGAKGANRAGFHIEQAGFARWPRETWLGEHDKLLRRAAYKTAFHLHLFKLPPVFLHAADLTAGRKGVTVHHECVLAFGGTHLCPGPNWPVDVFMRYVRSYYKQLGRDV